MKLGEFEDTQAAIDSLRENYAEQSAAGGYVWTSYTDPVSGQVVQETVPAPASGSMADLARLGVDIAKIYTAANGQQVKYVPVNTATGTVYKQQVMGGMLSDPLMLAGIGIAAFLLLKGK